MRLAMAVVGALGSAARVSALGVHSLRPAAVAPRRLPIAAGAAASPRVSLIRLQSGGPDRTVVEKCTAKIKEAIDPTELEIKGAYDDPNGSHITIYCVSDKFEGKRSLARQQMVFKAIWEEMQGPVHAVDTMVLKAPSEV